MGAFAVGTVVLIRFPFSDLSDSKLRPALVLAEVGNDDWILCQITSNPYADKRAIELIEKHFSSGSLLRTSYIRPGKLFTANQKLILRQVGRLDKNAFRLAIDAIVQLLSDGLQNTEDV